MPSIGKLALQITADHSGLNNDLTAASSKISGSAAKMQSTLGKALQMRMGGGIAGAAGGMGIGAMASAGKMMGVFGAATAAYGTMISLAGKANPGMLARFNDTWDDLIASIGAGFTPVLEAAIPAVRSLADAFVRMRPTIEDLANIMAAPLRLLERLANERPTPANPGAYAHSRFRESMEAMERERVARGMQPAFGNQYLNTQTPSSVGAAANRASFTTAEGFAQQAYIRAFESGGSASVAERTLSEAEQLRALVGSMNEFIVGALNGGNNRGLIP